MTIERLLSCILFWGGLAGAYFLTPWLGVLAVIGAFLFFYDLIVGRRTYKTVDRYEIVRDAKLRKDE